MPPPSPTTAATPKMRSVRCRRRACTTVSGGLNSATSTASAATRVKAARWCRKAIAADAYISSWRGGVDSGGAVLCVSAKWQLRGWTSRSKDFLQLRHNRPQCSSAHCTEPLREPHLVDRPQLIEHDQSLRTCVGDRDAEGRGETLARHRSHDDRTQVAV